MDEPGHVTIESDAIAVAARRSLSGLVGLASFALFLAPLVIMMVGGGVFGMKKPDGWADFVGVSWGAGAVAALAALIARVSEVARAGRLVIDDRAVSFARGSGATSPPATVLGGAVTPRPVGALLTLSLADGRMVTAKTPSEAAAHRALEALRIDPMGRPLVSRIKAGLLRGFSGFSAGFMLVLIGAWLKKEADLGVGTGLVWAALSLSLIASWFFVSRPPEISVGSDGVRIRERLTSRFIPLGRIASVNVEGFSTLVIKRTDGKEDRTRVPLGNAPMLFALAHRVELALRATQRETGSAARLELLERGERTFAAWREELRRRVQSGGYRQAALGDEELGAIVASSGATPEHRIGAALALRAAGGDAARERIRVAAEQCVNPRVRVALEKIAAVGGDRGGDEADREARSEAESEEEEFAVETALHRERREREAESDPPPPR